MSVPIRTKQKNKEILQIVSRPRRLDGRSKSENHKPSLLVLLQKERIGNVSCPRLSGKVAALADERG